MARYDDDALKTLKRELRDALAPILSALELRSARTDEVCSCERELIERHVHRMIALLDAPPDHPRGGG